MLFISKKTFPITESSPEGKYTKKWGVQMLQKRNMAERHLSAIHVYILNRCSFSAEKVLPRIREYIRQLCLRITQNPVDQRNGVDDIDLAILVEVGRPQPIWTGVET